MFKRHFTSALICLFLFIAGDYYVSAQSQLAQDAYAIFEASCLNCHGPDGAFRETLLIEHSELIDRGTVVPGNPNASELYKRLLGPTENGAQMPSGQEPLPAQSIETVRRWILAGAPDWTITPTTLRRFITPREVLTSIESHLNSLSSFDRSFARYFTMTHLYNAGETPEILAEYRAALYKLVNSLSWGNGIINPQPIDPQATIFYIDLRHYEWDRNDGWTKLEEAYPYHISFDAPAHLATRNQLGRLQTQMKTDVPSLHVDWFIATASTPPLYHELLSLPLTDSELETRLEVDVAANLVNAPGVRVWRAGFKNSGVSNHNRVVERHISRYGAYWKSYDFAGSAGRQNILTHPLNFTHDGGEVIFHLPNGLQGYYLSNASGLRLDEAPINIVSNPAASDPTVRNGISCIGCHTEGMKTFEDEVRSVIESNPNPPYDKAQALRLYVEQSEMDAHVEKDMDKYRDALEATGGEFGGIEPVSRFHEAFQGPVDAAYAAAVVGLQTETFLERVRENTGLQNVGLLALDNANGSVKRDTWASSFRDIISALDYPDRVGEPPVITQPEVLPGGQVHFPDSNLRAAVAEALGKNANAPITAEEMKGLRGLNASNRGIRDLTGIQFATNLDELLIDENNISDLSPLERLANLRRLRFKGNNVTDLSPVSSIINLEILTFHRNNVSDFPALAQLTKLEELGFNENKITDIGPLAGLINLTHISTWGNRFSDLSPLARLKKLEKVDICGADLSQASLAPLTNLPNLRELYLAGNGITDISLIARLTELDRLGLDHNRISNLSPLAGLTNLKWLSLHRNRISDLSPLTGLNNLTWLKISNNEITDLSILDGIRDNLNTLIAYGNLELLRGAGPKIEGPWLWVFLPTTRHKLNENVDLLAEASEGEVTEQKIGTAGATEGNAVGDAVWTLDRLPPTGRNNLIDMVGRRLPDGVMYGALFLHSPIKQDTTMFLGADQEVRVWLNGEVMYQRERSGHAEDYIEVFDVTLQRGKNVLLVAVATRPDDASNLFVGLHEDTEYSAGVIIDYVFSESSIHTADTFTLDVRLENVIDLAGWQFDLAFDPSVLEAKGVSEGGFLKSDGGATFFQSGRIDNLAGKITGLIAGRLSEGGASGSGSLLQVEFTAKSEGETELALGNFEFGSITGAKIPASPLEVRLTVEERLVTGDVNRDGRVSILDLILVAQQLGKRVAAGSPVDINADGIVNIFDLTLVAQGIVGAAAPAVGTGSVDAATIEAWIAEARLADDGSIVFQQGIANLQSLLTALIIPEETALHANYPNPFNPETWIPYQLAVPSDVTLTLYDMSGGVVRRLEVGHQAAGLYRSRNRALYWDGRNRDGEPVASGLYFYTLSAGEYTATRRMLVRK
ncbi:MAG: leucine-rich repeat domain-containing protein [Candidatus Poribacteria bacterium]|nr:leucine-rich repeat domain-containing protein [Candidatus Poribacteria bacterium]